jgi:high-affinity nickel-transport protein
MRAVTKLFNDQNAELRGKLAAIYAVLIGANVLAWIWAIVAFHDYPVLIGTAFLAYTFGLRHAVDADHIAAIDNVTRKLMQEGKRPVSVGFFFALGHSTIVVLGSVGVALATGALQGRFETFRLVGGLIGTSVSAVFLFLVAGANLLILLSVYRTFRAVRRGGTLVEDDLNQLLAQRGLLGRVFRPMFAMVARSWHMYPLGFLFGLGFDTATEIALLVMAGTSVASGLPFWAILSLPILFAAGMSLLDTADGSFMNFAYGWAFSNPIRKVYYNIVITALSVSVAFVIGTIELLSVLQSQFNLSGGLWDWAARFDINKAGYFIVGLFGITWVVAVLLWRVGQVENRWSDAAERMDQLTQAEASNA